MQPYNAFSFEIESLKNIITITFNNTHYQYILPNQFV